MFTVDELRRSIPAHCFKKSTVTSFLYLFRDVVLSTVVFLIGSYCYELLHTETTFSIIYNILSFCFYSFIQGNVWFGLWVLAHECGHGAFSPSQLICDIVGFMIHSFLLTPYFAWQYSHRIHHSKTNHTLDGETHVPDIEHKVQGLYKKIDATIGKTGVVYVSIVFHLLFGWPLYIINHTTGSKRNKVTKKRYMNRPNHFDPSNKNELFPSEMSFQILLGLLGVATMFCVLAYTSIIVGFYKVFYFYVGPYIVVNAWLVLVTWLHHTNKEVPHYGEDEWTWIKGALSTVDRPYPWIFDELHHYIGSTHVVHHIFSEIPFYHAKEATASIKTVLGSQYRDNETPILKALLETAKNCQYINDVYGMQYYKSIYD